MALVIPSSDSIRQVIAILQSNVYIAEKYLRWIQKSILVSLETYKNCWSTLGEFFDATQLSADDWEPMAWAQSSAGRSPTRRHSHERRVRYTFAHQRNGSLWIIHVSAPPPCRSDTCTVCIHARYRALMCRCAARSRFLLHGALRTHR